MVLLLSLLLLVLVKMVGILVMVLLLFGVGVLFSVKDDHLNVVPVVLRSDTGFIFVRDLTLLLLFLLSASSLVLVVWWNIYLTLHAHVCVSMLVFQPYLCNLDYNHYI
jgi:hypothetical protein